MCNNSNYLEYRNALILAPMVRISTLPMRLLALKYGAHIVYTEEIIDYKLIRCKRRVNHVLSTVEFVDDDGIVVLKTCAQETDRLVLQLGTSDPNRALIAAKLVEEDVAAIDINMGCPKEFSIKGGMGAKLLTQPEKIVAILTNLVKNIRKPISCKIRVLPNIEDSVKLAKLIESTGISALAVHGRTKEERPQHPNRNDVIAEISKSINICTIANGGSSQITKYEHIPLFGQKTCCSSVMIARAAIRNCSIFNKQNDLLPIDDVIKDYLKFAIDFDNNAMNTKYCIQQMLGSLQESVRGKALLAAQHINTICQLWHMSDYYYDKQRCIYERTKQKLDDISDINNVFVKRRKIITEKQDRIEMPFIFMRTLFGENDLPKSILLLWTHNKNIKIPQYRTTQIERHFHTVCTVDEKSYSSSYLEKCKKHSEQLAALVAIYCLKIFDNFEIIRECLIDETYCVKVLTNDRTFFIKTS